MAAQRENCARSKMKRTVETVNEKPLLRTRIWMGVSVSQKETQQLFRNSCPCAGKSKGCDSKRNEKKVISSIGCTNSLS